MSRSLEDIFSMKGKVVLITGATGLLGTQYSSTLARAGANVIISDLNEERCQDTAIILETAYCNDMLGIKTDISKKEEVKSMFEKINNHFGRLDVLINNAAFNCPAESKGSNFVDFEDYPLELWQRSLDVDLTGMFLCSQEAAKLMKPEKSGSIINIASTYGLVSPDQRVYREMRHPETGKGFVKPAGYATTKSGVLNFTRYLATLLGPHGIRVNTLTPGGVSDPNQDPTFVEEYCKRTPLGRMAEKTDYNGAILFLASDASRYMTGANLVVDGGWTAW
nr:short-chain dehydrogenase [Nanoarchaeum sp.]